MKVLFHQDAHLAVFQQQHGRQQQVVNFLQRPLHHPGGQVGPLGGPGKELYREPVLHQGQAGYQGRPGSSAAMEARQVDQAIQERIVLGRHRRRDGEGWRRLGGISWISFHLVRSKGGC